MCWWLEKITFLSHRLFEKVKTTCSTRGNTCHLLKWKEKRVNLCIPDFLWFFFSVNLHPIFDYLCKKLKKRISLIYIILCKRRSWLVKQNKTENILSFSFKKRISGLKRKRRSKHEAWDLYSVLKTDNFRWFLYCVWSEVKQIKWWVKFVVELVVFSFDFLWWWLCLC